VVGESDLSNTGFDSGRTLTVEAELVEGTNSLRFGFSQYRADGRHPRPVALVITDIMVERVDSVDVRLKSSDPRRLLDTVWSR
jgi:hypothetical protein